MINAKFVYLKFTTELYDAFSQVTNNNMNKLLRVNKIEVFLYSNASNTFFLGA